MALPENFVSRGDLDWPATGADYANPDQGLVIHYDSSDQGLADKPHSACVTYWNNTRSFHMNGRGWADVGYSFFCCPHDYILEGRGLNRYQAAQGTTAGNRDYYSATLATGPGESIPAAQINAVRRLRWWLIEDHGNHSQVLGHRDFTSTSCPGSKAYEMVTNGTFEKAPGEIMEVSDMLGLKKGDEGEAVKLLQLKVKRAGFGSALLYEGGPSNGIDSHYWDATAEGVRLCREYVGSLAEEGYGDKMTAHACDQLDAAVIKRMLENLGMDGSVADLPDEEDVTFVGTIHRG